ncbi:MAG: endonuclease/exonuclease/phosphatase family protein, partial [Steroidobacteraceae bacterium]|nr:endonuclease/exonuclease/phosphatase family protein [Steroidobacteraceae bacterium]
MLLLGCASQPAQQRLRLATWNIEYLLEPAVYAALRDRCVPDGGRVPGTERAIPCGIVPRLDRDAEDFAALARYARALDADVLALQEVDGPGAASLILSGYDYCFTNRANVQKNGFAIRRGLPFRCEPEYTALSLQDRVRNGVVVTLFPGTAHEMTLLNVHLKSGCPEGPLTSETDNCRMLSAQVGPLEEWIDAQARAGRRFAVLGDFNRRISRESGPARDAQGRPLNLWPEIDDGDPPGADLTAVTLAAPFRKCISNDPYDTYIDLLVFGAELARWIVPGSLIRVTYTDADAARYALSDHCPVGVDLRLPPLQPPRTAIST